MKINRDIVMLKKSIVLISLLGACSAVNASNYVGVGLGQASVDVTTVDFGPSVSTDVTDNDTSFKLYGGYAINEKVAVEAGYVNFGEFGVAYSDGVDSLAMNVEAKAFYIAVVGSMPVSQVRFFGKIGLANWTADASLTSTFVPAQSSSSSGTDPMVGLGVKFDVSDNVTLSAEIERYNNFGDEDETGESDIDVIGITAEMKF